MNTLIHFNTTDSDFFVFLENLTQDEVNLLRSFHGVYIDSSVSVSLSKEELAKVQEKIKDFFFEYVDASKEVIGVDKEHRFIPVKRLQFKYPIKSFIHPFEKIDMFIEIGILNSLSGYLDDENWNTY